MDLVSTIGESAALGAAGAIFWGEAEDAGSRVCVAFPPFSCLMQRQAQNGLLFFPRDVVSKPFDLLAVTILWGPG